MGKKISEVIGDTQVTFFLWKLTYQQAKNLEEMRVPTPLYLFPPQLTKKNGCVVLNL